MREVESRLNEALTALNAGQQEAVRGVTDASVVLAEVLHGCMEAKRDEAGDIPPERAEQILKVAHNYARRFNALMASALAAIDQAKAELEHIQ